MIQKIETIVRTIRHTADSVKYKNLTCSHFSQFYPLFPVARKSPIILNEISRVPDHSSNVQLQDFVLQGLVTWTRNGNLIDRR